MVLSLQGNQSRFTDRLQVTYYLHIIYYFLLPVKYCFRQFWTLPLVTLNFFAVPELLSVSSAYFPTSILNSFVYMLARYFFGVNPLNQKLRVCLGMLYFLLVAVIPIFRTLSRTTHFSCGVHFLFDTITPAFLNAFLSPWLGIAGSTSHSRPWVS